MFDLAKLILRLFVVELFTLCDAPVFPTCGVWASALNQRTFTTGLIAFQFSLVRLLLFIKWPNCPCGPTDQATPTRQTKILVCLAIETHL